MKNPKYTEVDSIAINRVQQMVLNRFGKTFKLNRLNDVTHLSSPSPWELQGTTLYIPLLSQNHFLGTGKVFMADDLSFKEMDTLAELIKVVLEPALYLTYLRRNENNLVNYDGFHTIKSLETFPDQSRDLSSGLKESSVPRRLLSLCSENEDFMNKFAFRIHDQTENWAFAKFLDIKGILECILDLEKFSNMTIYIDSIEELSVRNLSHLIEYCSTASTLNGPMFILGVRDKTQIPLPLLRESVVNLSQLPVNPKMQDEVINSILFDQ